MNTTSHASSHSNYTAAHHRHPFSAVNPALAVSSYLPSTSFPSDHEQTPPSAKRIRQTPKHEGQNMNSVLVREDEDRKNLENDDFNAATHWDSHFIKMPKVDCESAELIWSDGEPSISQYLMRDASECLEIRPDVVATILACEGVRSVGQGCGTIIIDMQQDIDHDDHELVWKRISTALAGFGFNIRRDDFELEAYAPVESCFDSKANQFCSITRTSTISLVQAGSGATGSTSTAPPSNSLPSTLNIDDVQSCAAGIITTSTSSTSETETSTTTTITPIASTATTSSASTSTRSAAAFPAKHFYSGNIVCYVNGLGPTRAITNFHTLCPDALEPDEFKDKDDFFRKQAILFGSDGTMTDIIPWCIDNVIPCHTSDRFRMRVDAAYYDDKLDVAFTEPLWRLPSYAYYEFTQRFGSQDVDRWMQWPVDHNVYKQMDDLLRLKRSNLVNYRFFLKLSRTPVSNSDSDSDVKRVAIVTDTNELELKFMRVSTKGRLNDVKSGSYVFTVAGDRDLSGTQPGDCGCVIVARLYSSTSILEFPLAYHYQRSRKVQTWELYAIPLYHCLKKMKDVFGMTENDGCWMMGRPTLTIPSPQEQQEQSQTGLY